MTRYTVTWVINDEDSETPLEAIWRALETQHRPDSTATVFDVRDTATGKRTRVDLTPGCNGAVTETLEETGHWCNGTPVWNPEGCTGGEWICKYCKNWYPGYQDTPAPAND
jgi:hypothetical protein